MAFTPIKIHRGTLTASTVVVYTSTGVSTIVKEIVLTNTTATARWASVLLGSVVLVPAAAIAANTAVVFSLSEVLAVGDTISAVAEVAAAVNCFISGVTF